MAGSRKRSAACDSKRKWRWNHCAGSKNLERNRPALRDAPGGGEPAEEVARRAGSHAVAGKRGSKKAAGTDKERLYREIGRLKMELDWLKKSPDYERGHKDAMDRG